MQISPQMFSLGKVQALARYFQLPDTGAIQWESSTSSEIVIPESPHTIATFQIVITP